MVRALEAADAEAVARAEAGEREADTGGKRRVLVHASGFKQSPYADIKPAGSPTQDGHRVASIVVPEHGTSPRKLWHSSPGSSGH